MNRAVESDRIEVEQDVVESGVAGSEVVVSGVAGSGAKDPVTEHGRLDWLRMSDKASRCVSQVLSYDLTPSRLRWPVRSITSCSSTPDW